MAIWICCVHASKGVKRQKGWNGSMARRWGKSVVVYGNSCCTNWFDGETLFLEFRTICKWILFDQLHRSFNSLVWCFRGSLCWHVPLCVSCFLVFPPKLLLPISHLGFVILFSIIGIVLYKFVIFACKEIAFVDTMN